jgi:hypothetical protein
VKLGIAGTIFSKFEAFFAKASMRGGWTAGSISLEFEGLFGKWLGLTRSGPSVSPIGRSRTASDVASFPGLLISQVSYVKDTTTVEYKQFLACLLFNLSTGPGRLARSRLREQERSNQNTEASFVSIGLIPTGIDECNTKIIIDTIRDLDLFRVEN